MATTVGEISVDIRAKFDKLSQDVNAAKGTVERGARDIRGVADTITGYLSAVGVGAFAGMIRSSIDAAGAFQDMSQKVGVAASTLSAYDYAAKMSGTTIDGVEKGLIKLSQSIVDTANGTGGAAKAFKALGVDVRDANGNLKSTDKVFEEVAGKFGDLEDGAGKTAVAVKLFGKSGAELIPLLNSGAEGLADMKQQAADLGLVISDETAASMESLGDKLDTVGMVGQGLTKQLAADLAPALHVVADMFLEGAQKGGALREAASLLGDGLKGLTSVGIGVAAVFDMLGSGLGALGAMAVQIAQGNFKTAGAIWEQYKTDAADATSYYADKLGKVWEKEKESQAAVEAQTKKTTVAYKGLGDETEGTAKKTADHEKQARKVIDALEMERAKMGASALQAEILKKQHEAGAGATKAQRDRIAELVTALYTEQAAQKELEAELSMLRKARDDHRAALQRETDGTRQKVADAQYELDTLGMSRTQVLELTIARQKNALAMREEEMAAIGKNEWDEAEIAALREQIGLNEELLTITRKTEVTQAQIKGAQDAEAAWTNAAQQIESSLTDALVQGFENGKGFGRSLIDYIKNLFKTTAIRFLLQPVTGAISGMLSPLAMAGNGAGAAGGAGGAMGGLGNLLSLGSNFLTGGPLFSGLASSLGSLAVGANGMMASGALANFGLGASTALNAGLAGIGGSISSGFAALGAGNIAGGLGALGGAAMSAAPYLAVAAAVYSYFKSKEGGDKVGGSAYAGGGTIMGSNYTEHQSDAEMMNLANSLQDQTDALIKAAGGRLGVKVGIGYSADPRGDAQTIIMSGVRGANGQQLWERGSENVGRSEEDLQAALQLESKRVMLAALQQSGLSEEYAKAFQGIDLKNATDAQADAALAIINNILAIKGAFESLGNTFPQLSGLAFSAQEAITNFSGGLANLQQRISFYFENFYTEGEKQARALDDLNARFKVMGISVDANKESFRALIESLDLSSEAGQRQYAALLELAPAFKSVIDMLGEGAAGVVLGTGTTSTGANAAAAAWWESYGATVEQQAADAATQNQAVVAATNSVADAVNQNGGAQVAAIDRMGDRVSSVVDSAISLTREAIISLERRLDAMESNARLTAAAP